MTAITHREPAPDTGPVGSDPLRLVEEPDALDGQWPTTGWVEVDRGAQVISLDDYRPAPRDRGLRRRLALFAGILALAVGLALAAGGGFADAELTDPVAGQAVLDPGETLWDIAVANAPDGVDPRSYLAAIRELNGFESAAVPVWTVVLLPQG